MYGSIIICALAAIPLVAAHGKVAVVTGDQGGNGTALGIRGAVVPGPGPNYLTEVDTTVFWSKDINTDDDIGYTDEAGNNQLTDLASAMAQSGSTLPQVSSGGSVSGTYHVVTDDGYGPLQALVDESATGKWSTASDATVTTQVPGNEGNAPTKRGLVNWAKNKMGVVSKRAENVNKDYDFAVEIPAGTSCNGTINGISNLCLVKVSNNNANGPFGGVFAVQMSTGTTNARVVRSAKFRQANQA
ncbi:Cell surface protein [Pleurostoma richardsiae]|uniref:Cell surface protein n=1 Tax=Pleurostoma richardsiae TaxID=41990 RepID=A0AA38VS16_9PEZI|nr:Cell surface protein [Pleurostoma richardsiae]